MRTFNQMLRRNLAIALLYLVGVAIIPAAAWIDWVHEFSPLNLLAGLVLMIGALNRTVQSPIPRTPIYLKSRDEKRKTAIIQLFAYSYSFLTVGITAIAPVLGEESLGPLFWLSGGACLGALLWFEPAITARRQQQTRPAEG